jgi:predicted ATPase/class 3 adenylate cyclase/tRNA A-37 threonylcarbamoyl transferase component Bud32
MISIPGYEIVEAIHRTDLRSVYRARRLSDDLEVVIKTLEPEYPTRQQVAELRRESQVLDRLQKVPSVIRAYALESYGNGNVALVLESFGRSVGDQIAAEGRRTLPLARVLSLGVAVAEALGQIHELDVIHKSVTPRNILVDNRSDAIRLIDFRISSELALERQGAASARHLEGALPYISPEQTGRMNRDLDYRSDYYSLGVTLFELLTGQLPLQGDSVLSWVHFHISRAAPSPSAVNTAIPMPVSAIVLKLLAKNAEDRYQSSYGLTEDLERCRRELEQTGSILKATLGQRDVSRKFQIPQRLYGRELERIALLALHERAVAGDAEFCMVSGHSGIGKSALANEISRAIVQHDGYLIQGKFDQFQRSKPYSAVASAFRGLVPQLLVESEAWRRDLLNDLVAAVSPNLGLLVELVPELEQIVGSQPSVPPLARTEAQNRFQITFVNFVKVIAAKRPLVIFLDDLHYADASTLNLIRWLATSRDLKRLFVVGAYRSNEVDVGHPLWLALNEITETRTIHELKLQPLNLESVKQLVADTMHSDKADCAPLAELLQEQADGNPFFLTEVLKTLAQSRAITFDPDFGRWRWNLDAARASAINANVVDFVVAKLRKLPAETQKALQLAACIGNTFDLRTLSIIDERSLDDTAKSLMPALQQHLIAPVNGDYKLVGITNGNQPAQADVPAVNPVYRFHHDRIQQAAYALIDEDRRQPVHLSIGRLIQTHADSPELEERLIEIVGHLNNGRRLITDPAEQIGLARLNLAAGVQAQRSSAYEAAINYVRIGQELLPHDSWTLEYRLTMDLAIEFQQCAYLTTRYDEAEYWIQEILAHARTTIEKAEILSMRTRQYATTGRMAESIDAAIMGLSLLRMRITANPDRRAVAREEALVKRNLAGRRVADLIDAPAMTDRVQVLVVRLLMEIFAAAFLSGSGNLFPFLVLKSVNLSLRYGNSPETAFSYGAYGMLLCGVLEEPALGYEFGKLAVAMNNRFDDIALKSRVIYLYAMFVMHWSEHWSKMTPWFRRGIEAGYQSGDLLYLAYSAQDCVIWDPKLDLDTAASEHADLLTIVRDCAYQDSFDSGSLFLQMQRNFLDLTDSLYSMNDATFDEKLCLEGMLKRRFMTGVANYHIYKAEIFFLYGDYGSALTHVREQDKLMASVMSLPQLVRFRIVAFLTLAAILPDMDVAQQKRTRSRLREERRVMARLAAHCPDNFLHLNLIMQAELARLAGWNERALRLYDEAIETARRCEFRRDEAMANELAARCLLASGRQKASEGYLRAARNLYDRWGARRKVARLEDEFPQLLKSIGTGRAVLASAAQASSTTPVDSAELDMTSIMKASRAISSEMVLDQLWIITMRIMLENAGGQRGCIVVWKGGQHVIEGLTEIGDEGSSTARSLPLAGPEGALTVPVSVVYAVLNGEGAVVLNDAATTREFARDAYFHSRKPQSILCVPFNRQRNVVGAIYMENSVASGVFTEDRIEIIKLLAAQTAISVENAELYQGQARLIEAQRRFVPSQFLESLARRDIAHVGVGEYVVKRMSVMFCDIRGFMRIAEHLDPRNVIELLNRYFSNMERPIVDAGGFIGSFAGDEIMALFEGTIASAVRAGVAMWRALDAFNVRNAELNQPTLNMGVGVNTGTVVLGTVGGENRIQCGVVGDTVNLASRVEQLTKIYDARFLVSGATYAELSDPDAFTIRLIDRTPVVGKSVPVDVYEVLDADPPDRRRMKVATRERLYVGMDAYFRGDFNTAQTLFELLRSEDPADRVLAIFVERCAPNLRKPPERQVTDRPASG